MRFLVDECTGPKVVIGLRAQKHEVLSVYHEAPSAEDYEVIQKAYDEGWILVTNDKDFGEKEYREQRPHRGVIFIRLEGQHAANKVEVLCLLEGFADRLAESFVVVTDTRVRFARP